MNKIDQYDFSKESSLKESLLKKCLLHLSETQAGRISDDELEYVSAAGSDFEEADCPFPLLNCEKCVNYEHGFIGKCKLGCKWRGNK